VPVQGAREKIQRRIVDVVHAFAGTIKRTYPPLSS
jgi:hypothetical protein